ncbi:MAG: hypothetical protein EON54_05250 [Alcaligenaceae bacterium]|nr:MAG: hypothetical protein EON54_05250 [Alcaligenaceae bacterium]
MKKLSIAALLSGISFFANAELMNIAAGGVQTADQGVTACTIVDSGTVPLDGTSLLIVLAEGSGNPDLLVWSMDRLYESRNKDWADGVDVIRPGESFHVNLRDMDPGLVYPTFLRAPTKLTDAAVFVFARLGERICATTYDRSGAGTSNFVALSITDINAIMFKSQKMKLMGLEDMRPDPREAALREMAGKVNAAN